MLSHINLVAYYDSIFALAQHHKYSITEIESLIPFERSFYVDMLISYLKKEEQKLKKQNKNMVYDNNIAFNPGDPIE